MTTPNTTQPAPPVAPKRKGKVWGRPFKKGQSGNPGGKSKAKESLADIARNATPEALKIMITIMRSEKASFAVRAYCADKIIDRAYGKPAQQNNVMIGTAQRSIRELSDAELMQIIERGRAEPPLIEQQPVEVEPSAEPQPVAEDVGEIVGAISETPE
jgi:hypothetical protein